MIETITELDALRARVNGWKVVPACSYASVYITKHPEYADLVA